ncbi:MAG: hypothetical protein KAY24_17640 [Candidatus Eisenbacteria sp.]|nr:hypothetical protein [Candidatus Eisenbacteria bacterium]
MNGRLSRALVDGKLPAGLRRIPWDGLDDLDRALPSGTYFYQLRVDGETVGTEKAVALK